MPPFEFIDREKQELITKFLEDGKLRQIGWARDELRRWRSDNGFDCDEGSSREQNSNLWSTALVMLDEPRFAESIASFADDLFEGKAEQQLDAVRPHVPPPSQNPLRRVFGGKSARDVPSREAYGNMLSTERLSWFIRLLAYEVSAMIIRQMCIQEGR